MLLLLYPAARRITISTIFLERRGVINENRLGLCKSCNELCFLQGLKEIFNLSGEEMITQSS
jgi:hypothetical protein